MSTQYLETYNGNETGATTSRRMDARDERVLLLNAKTGDLVAFEILCKQSANTVFHLARRIMRNNEDAEDVVQESFQQAFIHLQRFNGDSRFSTWLSRIAINAALMKLRKKHRFWEVSLDESAEAEQPFSHVDVADKALNLVLGDGEDLGVEGVVVFDGGHGECVLNHLRRRRYLGIAIG